MKKHSRRAFLATLAVGALGGSVLMSACGASASPTAAPASTATPAATPAGTPVGQTSSSFRGMTLAFVGGSYFVAAGQDLFTKQLNQWGSDNGVKVSADYLNWPDLQAKIAAAVQAGAGADMVELWPAWPYLYQAALADLSGVAQSVGQAAGDYFDWATSSVQVGGAWLGVPTGSSPGDPQRHVRRLQGRVYHSRQVGTDRVQVGGALQAGLPGLRHGVMTPTAP